MEQCNKCENCTIAVDAELCMRAKCTATARGKTIYWHMATCYDGSTGKKLNVKKILKDWLAKHKSPTWCPKKSCNND